MCNLNHCVLWLALVSGTSAIPEYAMERKAFKLPILASEDLRQHFDQVLLFVSVDEGKAWRQAASATPDQTHFFFQAPKDGSYWFAIQIVSKNGEKFPAEVSNLTAEMKVVVTTPVISAKPNERETELAELRAKVMELEAGVQLAELRAKVKELEKRLKRIEKSR